MALKTVRDAIADQLIDQCTSFAGFYQPQLANDKTPAPFGVIMMSVDTAEPSHGLLKKVQVAVHTRNRDDLNELDALVYEVMDALDDVYVSCGLDDDDREHFIIPEHTGTTGEWFDDDRRTVMRIVEFEVAIAR